MNLLDLSTLYDITMETKIWNKNFVILCISNFLIAFAFYALLAVLPLYLNQVLKISRNEIGIILSAYTLGALLIRPLSGYAFDHFNKRRVLFLSIAFFSVLFLFYMWLEGTAALIMLRFVQGLAWGVLTTGMVTVSVDIIPAARRGEGIGYLGISMTLAMALAPPVAVWFVTIYNFVYLFNLATLIALFAFATVLFVKLGNNVSEHRKPLGIQIISKVALPVSLCMMFVTMGYGGIMSFITLFAKSIGILQPGRFFIFLALGLIFTRFFSGKIFDRYGSFWLSLSGFVAIILGLLFLSFARSEFIFLFSACLIGLGFGNLIPTTQAMINNLVTPQNRGAGNSTFLTFFDLGIGGGMLLTGAIAELFSYKTAYFACATITLLSAIYFFTFVLKHYNKYKL